MKKKFILFVLLLSIVAIGLKAQNFTFKDGGDNVLADTFFVQIDNGGGVDYSFIHFVNISGADKSIKVRLTDVSLASGAELQMCFDGNCLSALLSPNPITIQQDSIYDKFDLVYSYANGNNSLVKVNLVDAQDTNNVYQSLFVKYTTSVSLDKPALKPIVALSVDAFPNPTSNSVTVKYSLPSNYSNGKITIRNMIGRTLKSINIKEGINGKHVISTADLPSGVYFYSIMGNGRTLSTKKLVVKH